MNLTFVHVFKVQKLTASMPKGIGNIIYNIVQLIFLSGVQKMFVIYYYVILCAMGKNI